ncbi:MAG: bifunctional hydroxymethylpyrimidine kinase/phosphomethylpyrimidine kinase [Myxococcota bacterium]|jgi:hydroxymethylpyrimidine/phosphomethylpyrimidine kinase|nr:bifunctional hydroxymethylpyrimidine kinase/phosphomethylpyrimidine kinase [Myxococcota bacterium]
MREPRLITHLSDAELKPLDVRAATDKTVTFVDAFEPRCESGLGLALRTAALLGVPARAVLLALRLEASRPAMVSETDFAQQLAEATRESELLCVAMLGPLAVPRLLEAALVQLESEAAEHHCAMLLDVNLLARDGRRLVSEEALESARRTLFGRSRVLMANTEEASLLLGRTVQGMDGMRQACFRLGELGPQSVLLTGGRTQGHALDLFFDGSDIFEFGADREPTWDLRGAGVLLRASLSCGIVRDLPLLAAVEEAKSDVTAAIRKARRIGDRWVCEPQGCASA